MGKQRIKLSEEQKRRLLVETGHKCSISGCNVKEDWMFHHINFDPSDNRDNNILVLCPNHAAMADKKKITQKACESYKRRLIIGEVSKEQESIKEIVEKEGIDLEPESLVRKIAIIYGRKYLNWRYGRYDVTAKREIAGLILIGIIFLLPIFYDVWKISQRIMVTSSEIYFFILIIPAVLSFGTAELMISTKCKNCNKFFGIRVVDSKQVDQKELYKTKIEIKREITLRNTYECEYCRNREIKNEIIYETIPIT